MNESVIADHPPTGLSQLGMSAPGVKPGTTKHKNTTVRFWTLIAVNVAAVIALFTSQTNEATGLWAIGLMVAMMLVGLPIGVALSLASVAGLLHVSGGAAAVNVLASAPFTASSSWSMSVLPMFILMG